MSITWVLESGVFPNGDVLRSAAAAGGPRVVEWSDEWWGSGAPELAEPVVFHGSLGNADRIVRELTWRPGAFCNTEAFACSLYETARKWLLHEAWVVLPASEFVQRRDEILARFGGVGGVFVRPDSPLKPFSGRVLTRDQISLAALDCGFYYEDPDLPVMAAPIRDVGNEYRYVVVSRQVVAGSAYEANGRTRKAADPGGAPWMLASEISESIEPPDIAYVLDICEVDGGLRLLELNPFSGADLYASDGAAIVLAIDECLREEPHTA